MRRKGKSERRKFESKINLRKEKRRKRRDEAFYWLTMERGRRWNSAALWSDGRIENWAGKKSKLRKSKREGKEKKKSIRKSYALAGNL